MKYILQQSWGGLGDNLQFASLPEMLSKNGHEFYLHVNNRYRNSEIYDLVWKNNPYVKGIVGDELPNAGECKVSQMVQFSTEINFIRRWELAHGIDCPRENYYPKLFYTPKKIKELEGKNVICISGITLTPDYYTRVGLIEELKNLIGEESNVSLIFGDDINLPHLVYGDETLLVKDIYHHCDIIHSCKRYVTIFSGSAVLASILKATSSSPDIHVYIAPETGDHRNLFIFENTNYHRLWKK